MKRLSEFPPPFFFHRHVGLVSLWLPVSYIIHNVIEGGFQHAHDATKSAECSDCGEVGLASATLKESDAAVLYSFSLSG